jgi:hypothetical protein
MTRAAVSFVTFFVAFFAARGAAADLVEAAPLSPIVAPFPAGVPPVETQVVLQIVVDANGSVESAVETARAPKDAPDALALAAVDAAKGAKFTPSSRDGQSIRSRIEYVVVFQSDADRDIESDLDQTYVALRVAGSGRKRPCPRSRLGVPARARRRPRRPRAPHRRPSPANERDALRGPWLLRRPRRR